MNVNVPLALTPVPEGLNPPFSELQIRRLDVIHGTKEGQAARPPTEMMWIELIFNEANKIDRFVNTFGTTLSQYGKLMQLTQWGEKGCLRISCAVGPKLDDLFDYLSMQFPSLYPVLRPQRRPLLKFL
ncbi:MAG: hypothetical protein WCF19_01015 [Chlamydiales bacterium]